MQRLNDAPLDRAVEDPDINSPGLALAGHTARLASGRRQDGHRAQIDRLGGERAPVEGLALPRHEQISRLHHVPRAAQDLGNKTVGATGHLGLVVEPYNTLGLRNQWCG